MRSRGADRAARRGRRSRRRGDRAVFEVAALRGLPAVESALAGVPGGAEAGAAAPAGGGRARRPWGSASSSRWTSRSCAAWRTTPAPCSSCSTPAGRSAPSAAADATTACSQALGGVDLPALGFGMGDVVLGELLRDRGLVPADASSIDVFLAAVTEEDLPLRPGAGARAPRRGAPRRVRARRPGGGQAAQAGRRAERAVRRRDRAGRPGAGRGDAQGSGGEGAGGGPAGLRWSSGCRGQFADVERSQRRVHMDNQLEEHEWRTRRR